MFCIIGTTPQLYLKVNFLLPSPRGDKIKQQTMTKIKDGLRSSRASMPQKDYIILGNNVYKRTNKLPEDVLGDLLDEEEEVPTPAPEENRVKAFSLERLGQSIKAVQKYFWAQSCYGVIYSAVRDTCGQQYTMTQFEVDVQTLRKEMRFDYNCPTGTLATAFCRNRYLKLHIDKWQQRGVKQRSIDLVEYFIEHMNK